MNQVELLMSAIATNISGREVVATIGALSAFGRVQKHSGRLALFINQDIGRKQALEIFLHELSHCIHDAHILADLDNPQEANKAVFRQRDGIEKRADRDSRRWARRIRRHVPEKHNLAKQLLWLLNHIEVLR